MSILIAFLGGMLTLLSPCTLPVIPLLFASVRGRRGQLAIMLAGMALMFGAVSWLVTVASGWVVNLTLAGRGLALAFFALVGLSLLSQRVAQRLTSLQSAGGLSQALEQRLAARLPQPEQKTSLQPIAAPQPSSAMPSLAGGSAWINSPALTPERLKGKVVLVDFWTRECINCQHTLPYVRDWANKYRAAGLVVIGVHTPEYPWERSLPLLRQAVKDWRITYPVVADNEYAIWNAFGNQYWPAHYIFDARGQLRYTAFGEGDYARQEQVIQQLLQESKA
ncbi:TPA: cytochrome c biogenesis protein/redoxin [Klebsiella pneumoniae]